MMKNSLRTLLTLGLVLILLVGMCPPALSAIAQESETLCAAPDLLFFDSAASASVESNALTAAGVDVAALEAHLRPLLIQCEPSISLEEFNIPNDGDIIQALYQYIHYFMLDCFHYHSSQFWSRSGKLTRMDVTYYEFANTADAYRTAWGQITAAANKMLAGVEGNDALSNAEKALLLHDRLALWNEYDTTVFQAGATVPPVSYTMYGAFVERRSVCQGYTYAYMYLLSRVGIDSTYCSSQTLNHIWNIVYIDDVAYHVDVTWDDPVQDITGRIAHDYFLLSSDALYAKRAASGSVATDFDATPTATTYDEAYWQNSSTAFQYVDGSLYYIDNEAATLNQVQGDTARTLLSVKDSWKSSGGGTWQGNYARLSSDGTRLLYSLTDTVYRYDFATKTAQAIFTPAKPATGLLSIYGFMYEDGYLVCDRNDSPNFTATTKQANQLREPFDTENPTAQIAATNDPAATQTVTLTLTDNAVVAGYYWGTDETPDANPYVAVDTLPVTCTVSKSGTYYLTAVDGMGNRSDTQHITFYMTTLDPAYDGAEPIRILSAAGAAVTLPQPEREAYRFKGWSATADGDAINTTLTPQADATYYALWESTEEPPAPCTHQNRTTVEGRTTACRVWEGYQRCDDCGQLFSEDGTTPIDKQVVRVLQEHTLQHVTATAPNGDTAGNTEYWYCDACHACFADANGNTELDRDDTIVLPVGTLTGDANGDGKVNTADAALVLQYAAELLPDEAVQLTAADVDGNGKVSTADAALILQYAAELLSRFPVDAA